MQKIIGVSVLSGLDADVLNGKIQEQLDILGGDPSVAPSFDYHTNVIGNKVHHSVLITWWAWSDTPIPVYRPEVQVTRDDQTADWVVRVDGVPRYRVFSDGSGFEEV